MRSYVSSVFTLLAISCLLSACGFQLRGVGGNTVSVPDDWKLMYLSSGNPNSELTRAVISQFAANGVEWTDRNSANFILQLGGERFNQRSISLNAEARAAEFELTMRTHFTVRQADNTEVIPRTTASVVKQMENDPRNVVGKAEEVRLLKTEMRGEIARQIMRRIGFFAAGGRSVGQGADQDGDAGGRPAEGRPTED